MEADSLGAERRSVLPLDLSLLSLRRARPEDAEAMADIAALVNIHNYARFDRGFLFYSLTAEEYGSRIGTGHTVYVLEYGNEVVGFSCGVSSKTLHEILATRENVYGSVYDATARIAREREIDSFIMIDQIAILPSHQNRGIGGFFFDKLCSLDEGPFFGDMLESPLRNPRIAYWCKRGFVKVGEVTETPPERFKALENSLGEFKKLTWGIYFLGSNSSLT